MSQNIVCTGVLKHNFLFFYVTTYSSFFNIRSNFLPSPLAGKGEDKEYPTIGARMIRLEDKVGTPLLVSLCVFFSANRRDKVIRSAYEVAVTGMTANRALVCDQ